MKTYGTCTYNKRNSCWDLKVEPHVAIRLKRVFAKIDTWSYGTLSISATVENCRDLQWFLERYPMEVFPWELMKERADKHRERQSLVEQLLAGKIQHEPFNLKLPPREYQSLAATMWLASGGLLLADDVGLGKAQPLSAHIHTPSGWRLMGELCVGDVVTDPDGGVGQVTGVFPQGEEDVYTLKTSDGATAECSREHLWLVETYNDRRRHTDRVMSLSEFKDDLFDYRHKGEKWKTSRYFLPLISPLELTDNQLPFSPYIVGAILGYGSFRQRHCVRLTCADKPVVDMIRELLPSELTIKLGSLKNPIEWNIPRKVPTNQTNQTNPLTQWAKDQNLWGKYAYDKHIPYDYLNSSISDRIELIRGLMDTDGECSVAGLAYFSTTSPQLRDGIVQVIRSLGGIAKISPPRRKTYKGKLGEKKIGRLSWSITVQTTFNPFHLVRKQSRWKIPYMARGIVSVVPKNRELTQCIKVSTKRSLYITNDFLPTHNTCSAIAGLSDPRTLPALVVTLSHLPIQWQSEINKFSGLTTHILKKGTPYDILKYTDGKLPDVFITNYHKLSGWAETLAPLLHGVVFDEIQELRHRGTQKYNAAKHIAESCEFRLGTSATPIYNYGGEIWNILNVLTPDAIGTADEFEREWCSTAFGDKVKIKDPAAFGLYARETGVMLRRTRIEVKRELPAVTVVPHRIDVDPKVIQNMAGQAIELAKLILKQTQDFKGQKMQAAGEFDMKMRQATGIAKAPYVAEFVKFLVEDNDEPVVLFGWHRECYSIWMEKLKDLNPVMYTGSESSTQKEAAKKAFIEGKSKVMIISLRAGAGMDGLQDVCHLGVFGELDWSPGVHEQCIGRFHRDGQDQPCTAYYLLSEHGSDPIISDILGIKKQQIEGVRDPNQDLVTKLQTTGDDYIKKMAQKFLSDHGIQMDIPNKEEDDDTRKDQAD